MFCGICETETLYLIIYMLATLQIYDAILIYTLAIMGLLAIILLVCIFSRNAGDWKISRITLRQCQKCNLVFAASRFAKNHRIPCPRCQSDTKIIQSQDS